ncbi:hypothetical protein AO385_0494 [Moraxella catarrhalis]|uniref:Uncharacterized protein n=1 Tax=Moraxella catarrhalis TaxID=480 RepID=A0A198UQ32_MORCA|nr:hypothetical protein AO383_1208 [Moraxella catarrhalis]OAU98466.1 hypothetical protein AO384_0050 [Moraxella catarrhalis]OAV03416.1 hypothetical protein AO385_0494 [Moraxella catarrhalis]
MVINLPLHLVKLVASLFCLTLEIFGADSLIEQSPNPLAR